MAEARNDNRGLLRRAVRAVRRRPATPAEAPPAPAAAGSLGAAEQAALAQLDAADGYATRWPVSRAVARALASRQLVVIAPDYVLLTEAGRRALTGDATAGGG